MRILVLTNLYPPHYLGGYELICRAVVNALRARGHTLEVLTSDHQNPEGPGGAPSPQRPANDGAVGIEGLVSSDHRVRESRDGGGRTPRPGLTVRRALRLHGFYGHPWLGIGRLRNLEQHNNQVLRAALAVFRPDLVYVWNMGGLSKSLLFTLQRLGFPTVFYLSDHWIARGLKSDVWLRWWNEPARTFPQRVLRAVWEQSGRRQHWDGDAPTRPVCELSFRRIYFCSRALREEAVAAGFAVSHAAVIYCPVDTNLFYGEPRPISQPFQRLLYVGRLSPDKGALTALRALASLSGQFKGTLTIFGQGDSEYVRQLRGFARERALPVIFGAATQEQMPAVYREHDGLLFTSEWAEPFALAPLEAMASGLAVIGTTTGGSAELFRHGENGLTYPAGNAPQLAERIATFAAHPALRLRCATTGFCEVRQRYAEPVIVDQIETYLQDTRALWSETPAPKAG